ncbi:hypothetical protein J2Y38_004032 [Flavobacterium sp. 2755]|uniref:hypothetical protein n=1 Tax=Flavobacterium sp. 2755 TaxID=2817765 RepID=UPI00285778C0|nr:hypothetical protein [Flavobacterium sp. 2755]MDR6763808.1 hypothetical protein [Flavobacterium sp. 2755]
MHQIELLGTSSKNFKIKFISILKQTSVFDTKTLASLYDSLCDSKKVIIKFKELDISYLNDIVVELIELEIWIGQSSFHEEDGYSFEE